MATVDTPLPTTDFGRVTKQLVQTQLLEALKSQEDYLDTLVASVMNAEVDESGGAPSYHSREKMPWLEWTTRDTLRTSIRAAVIEVVQEMEGEIKEAVQKSLASDDVVSAFTKMIIQSVTDRSFMIWHEDKISD